DGTLLARAGQFAEELLLLDLDLPEAVDEPLPKPAAAEMAISRTTVQVPASTGGERVAGTVAPRLTEDAEVWQALVLGLRDYVRKNGFRTVILGLSGGIDSSVVAAIAVDALGPQQVHGVSMPSGHSSDHSRDDAADLATRTGLHYSVVPIQTM